MTTSAEKLNAYINQHEDVIAANPEEIRDPYDRKLCAAFVEKFPVGVRNHSDLPTGSTIVGHTYSLSNNSFVVHYSVRGQLTGTCFTNEQVGEMAYE